MRNRITQHAPVERSFRTFAIEAGRLNYTAVKRARAQRERHRARLAGAYRTRPTPER